MGFVDSNYRSKLDKCRSTIGYVFTLVGKPICWKSTLLSIVALFATEAKYVVVIKAFKETIWLYGLVEDLGLKHNHIVIYCDSQSVIYVEKDQIHHF